MSASIQNTTKTQDVFEELKLALILSYIRRIDEIEDLINNCNFSDALRAMCTFINRLVIPETETELLTAKSDLNRNQQGSFITSSNTQRYFEQINAYLNKTYFAEFHGRAKPRNPNTPTLKLPEAKMTL
jgi:hypothetical protein